MAKERMITEYTKVIDEKTIIVYVNETKLTAQCFQGRAIKASWRYRFKNIEHMNNYIAEAIKNHKAGELTRARWKAAQKAENDKILTIVKKGDIFSTSWGYEQTNVEFYQVIEKKGSTLKIRRIAGELVSEDSYMSGKKKPIINEWIGEDILTRRLSNGHLKINDYIQASLTDPETAHYVSWYA